jgi:DNA mismatch endonuclease (patch repair protein)
MSRHPRRDTGPELALRKVLHAAGYRYRIQYPVPGRPRRTIDVAFTKQKVAVFVDGCFWHGCTTHRGVPTANNAWWQAKLAKNLTRDADTSAHLRELGWAVVRAWEHEAPDEALARIEAVLNADRLQHGGQI